MGKVRDDLSNSVVVELQLNKIAAYHIPLERHSNQPNLI